RSAQMPKPDPRIVSAARLQHAKKYPAAEAIYLQILRKEPRHPDARFLLGLLLHQTARHEAAVDELRQAIAIQPGNADFRRTLIETDRNRGIPMPAFCWDFFCIRPPGMRQPSMSFARRLPFSRVTPTFAGH